VKRADAVAYLGKANEYLLAAQESLRAKNYTAATGNAIHAGIAGSDAIAAAVAGSVWNGEHSQSAAYLEKTGPEGKKAGPHLRRLLPLKNQAEYDPSPLSPDAARSAVKSAERLITIAARAVAAQASNSPTS
jgi:hypothetical protein